MRAEIKEYIRNVIGKLNNKSDILGYNDKVCFLKYYTGFSIEEIEIINIIATVDIECDTLFYVYDGSIMQDVYNPFMAFIKEMYIKHYANKISPEEFVEAAGCYNALKYLYVSYLKNDYFEREEDLILKEVDFDKNRIPQDIVNLIKYISDEHNIVIVLDRLQEAQESSLRLLLTMVKDENVKNVALISSYNETMDISSYIRDTWNSLMDYVRIRDFVTDYDDGKSEANQRDIFVPKEADVDNYLRIIKNMLWTIEFEEAKFYLDILYNAMENSNLNFTVSQKATMLNLYARILLFNGEDKIAHVYCKKIYDIEQNKRTPEIMYEYYYTLSLIYLASSQIELASENIEKAKDIANELNDKDKLVRISMVNIISLLNRYPEVLILGMDINIPQYLLDMAKENNQEMHLAYAYIFGVDLHILPEKLSDTKVGCENIPEFYEGINLAKKLGNGQLLIRAWQRAAVQAGTNGLFDDVLYYYGKCLEIIKEMDRKHEEAQIYNGIGYTSLLNEKYDLACDYFKKAIEIGIYVGTPKYILDALYNLSITGVVMGDYDATIRSIEIIIKLMAGMGIERLNVCNKTKLYGLLIFSHIKKGQIYNAKLYIDLMETAMNHILKSDKPDYLFWEDDTYLYYTVKAMMYMETKEYGLAKETFVKLEEFWSKLSAKQNYILPRVIEEEAKLYEILGEMDTREKLLKRTIDFCKNNALQKSAKRLQNILDGIEPEPFEKMNYISGDMIKEIGNTADMIELRLKLQKKDKMIHFFENWVDVLNECFTHIDDLVNNSIVAMKNTFDIDSVLYINIKNGNENIVYYDGDREIKKYQVKYICDYFEEHHRRLIVSRFLKSYTYNEELISVFNRDDIASMIAIPYVVKENVSDIFILFKYRRANYTENLLLFNEEEADVLRTALSELMEAIAREKIKKQIEKNAVTDMLTGIYNRQGLRKILDNNFEEREGNGITGKTAFTILYMDLDNFKFCNDHYGHEIGDVVLKAFSKMLRDIVENEGILVRYGGDEFVIVMPDRDEKDGTEIAEKIFMNIKHTKGFKKEIEKARKEETDIAPENRVTCSIGIATGNASTYFGVLSILKKADEALYFVKNTTKHDYKVWNQSVRDSSNS